jgi:hypothetical protein
MKSSSQVRGRYMKRRIAETLVTLTAGILALALILGIGYAGFRFYRWVNWSMAYDAKVRETITEMVKPECLREF